MPVIVYKQELKFDNITEKVHIAFDCEYTSYGSLKIKNFEPDYFDSGDFRIKIEEVIKKFDVEILNKYLKKNNDVYYLAILNYFVNEIPSIYSIKFVNENDETIYYASEIK